MIELLLVAHLAQVQPHQLGGCTSPDLLEMGSSRFQCAERPWIDAGTFLRPEDSGDNAILGDTTEASADIQLFATGAAIFNKQKATVDFQVKSDLWDNAFLVDSTNDCVYVGQGGGCQTPLSTYGFFQVVTGDSSGAVFSFRTSGLTNNPGFVVSVDEAGNGIILEQTGTSTGYMSFETNTAQRIIIEKLGDIGIQVADPVETFHILDTLKLGSAVDTTDGQLKIHSEQGVTDYTITVNPHASMTQDVTYTLPADDGDDGEVLQTDGAGALSWQPVRSYDKYIQAVTASGLTESWTEEREDIFMGLNDLNFVPDTGVCYIYAYNLGGDATSFEYRIYDNTDGEAICTITGITTEARYTGTCSGGCNWHDNTTDDLESQARRVGGTSGNFSLYGAIRVVE